MIWQRRVIDMKLYDQEAGSLVRYNAHTTCMPSCEFRTEMYMNERTVLHLEVRNVSGKTAAQHDLQWRLHCNLKRDACTEKYCISTNV